ncbi:hypothetical protein GCM10009720_09840 [Yaniella flava]|uniref:Uncharacterized protein n=1 Tax=Yaniella flava TaxID=287930 RepID=A0ABP5FQJ9_9MICC
MVDTGPSEESAKAPTAIAAAQQFLDLSQEYLELVPKLKSQALPIGNSARSRTTKRVAALAVVMQRKFVTRRENTYMPGILERILAEHKDELSPETRKNITAFKHELSGAVKQLHEANAIINDGTNKSASTAVVVPQITYGRLLHADYQKWQDGGPNPWFTAALSFLVSQDRFRDYIEKMRSCLMDLTEQNILESLAYEFNIEEDFLSPNGKIE